MLSNPTQVNLPDFVSFLATVAGIPPPRKPQLVPYQMGVATGGTTQQLTDVTQAWNANTWQGMTLVDVTQSQASVVASNDATNLALVSVLSTSVAIGDQYYVGVDSIPTSLATAQLIVIKGLARVAPAMYVQAVYYLAIDLLINFGLDVVC